MSERFLFGIDIGGTSVKMGLFTDEGGLLAKRSFKSAATSGGVIADCCGNISALLSEYGITPRQVVGTGVGVPGPVGRDGVVHGCVNMGWGDVPLTAELERRSGIRATAQNDANAAALGEYWRGAGRESRSMIMITLGTGVGGAAILDGRLLTGAHNTGGELGHMCVNRKETAVCNCGRRGCLEQYTSATGIVRLARLELERCPGEPTGLRGEEVTAKRVLDLSAQGDPMAGRVFERMTAMLGFGLATVSVICDPEVIVIGGGVSLAGDYLLDGIKRQYLAFAYKDMTDTRITLARLSADAGIYGAAYMALNSFK